MAVPSTPFVDDPDDPVTVTPPAPPTENVPQFSRPLTERIFVAAMLTLSPSVYDAPDATVTPISNVASGGIKALN